MTKLCGEVKAISGPVGGGMRTTQTEYQYSDGSSEVKSNWYKSRMVFPVVEVGDTRLQNVFVANDQLGHQIGKTVHPGDRVCLFVYGHLLRKKVIIGVKSESGPALLLPARGLMSGLFWYAIISPIVVAIPAVIIGMIVGMLGGQRGTVMGLMFGFLYAVGMSWLSGFRFYQAYQEMRANS